MGVLELKPIHLESAMEVEEGYLRGSWGSWTLSTRVWNNAWFGSSFLHIMICNAFQ